VGTTVGIVITVLVNATVFSRTGGRSSDAEGEEEEGKTREYTLDIRSEGSRTRIMADGEDTLWIYGQVRCSDQSVDCSSMTGGLSFVPRGPNASWIKFKSTEWSQGFKAVQISVVPPTEDADLIEGEDKIEVRGTIEGNQTQGPIDLELERYRLLIKPTDGPASESA